MFFVRTLSGEQAIVVGCFRCWAESSMSQYGLDLSARGLGEAQGIGFVGVEAWPGSSRVVRFTGPASQWIAWHKQ